MASRKDQLQAYQFLVQRFVSALIMRETDPAQVPFRRLSGAAFASVMIAVLALAAVGLYGLFRPGGGTRFQGSDGVIVEKETGQKYVLVDGVLHPVANYASAVLITGSTATDPVSRASLVDVPRGAQLGIAGAPDSIPARAQLLRGAWSFCVALRENAAGDREPVSVLVVGNEPPGGHRLANRAVVVAERGTGRLALVAGGHQYPITDGDMVLRALGLENRSRVSTTSAWLNALPAGRPIAPIVPPDLGNASAARGGARVGQVLVATAGDGTRTYYLVRGDRLEAITPLQATLQLDLDDIRRAYPDGQVKALEIPAQDVRDVALPARRPEDPPAEVPEFDRAATGATTSCARFEGARADPSITLDARPPAGVPVDGTGVLADRVDVPFGHAALVRAFTSGASTSGRDYLVTDAGRGFPLSSAEVASMFGYDGVRPIDLPAGVVARLPVGSTLDPAAAARPVADR